MKQGKSEALRLQTVSRAVSVLRCFDEGQSSLSLAELTKRAGLNKATVFRLAETLTAEGLLQKDEDRGCYSISFGLVSLGRALLDPDGLGTYAEPILDTASRETGETAILHVKRRHEAAVIVEIPSPEPVRYTLGVGFRADLRVGAAGLAILAHMPEGESRAIIDGPQVRTVSGAEIGVRELRDGIRETRERGYATTTGQRLKDAAGYAAPLFGQSGQVIGSIGVIMPAHRNQIPERQAVFARTVIKAARDVNEIIGGRPPENIS